VTRTAAEPADLWVLGYVTTDDLLLAARGPRAVAIKLGAAGNHPAVGQSRR